MTDCEDNRPRHEQISDYVDTTIGDMIDEAPYWKIGRGESQPTWFEIRDAIVAKVFAVEHEMGRQELHAELVREGSL